MDREVEGVCGRMCLAAVLLLFGCLLWVGAAGAQIEQINTYIGRANLDGSGLDLRFIKAVGSGGSLAVDGQYIYWTGYGVIGRAKLDGSDVQPIFIRVPMISDRGGMVIGPTMLEIDGGYLYWAVNDMAPYVGSNQLWRAKLDGSGIELVLDREAGVDAVRDGYVYWRFPASGSIGRAKLDGTEATPDFIHTGATTLMGVGVFGTHVYWTDQCDTMWVWPRCDDGLIGRANLDGSGVQLQFIGGLAVPEALAFGGGHIYWTDRCNFAQGNAVCLSDTIGRANLDGSGVQRSLIAFPRSTLFGLAVEGNHVYFISSPKKWLDGLQIVPQTFRLTGRVVDGRCTRQTSQNRTHRRCTRPIRLQISYRLNWPSNVMFSVRRRLAGRRVNGRCVAPTTGNRRYPDCTRLTYIPGAQGFSRIGRAGSNTFSFDGTLVINKEVNGRIHPIPYKLTPGSYQLAAWTLGGGNTPKSVGFRITR